VVSITLRDNADEFRVEIAGRFAGTVVDDVLYMWKSVLKEGDSRRFTIDITQLSGYDYAGCSLLTDMQKHGTHISAGSALSLVFLNEISSPMRKLGPALVRKKPRSEGSRQDQPVVEFPLVSVAAGE
jgi:ABC-type transporter Mla MlaB component